MIDQVFEIAEHALPDFLARIAKLSKKSIKLLGKPIKPVLHGTIIREITINGRRFDSEGNRYVCTYHQVSVTGETPKINGWTFMGTIDHKGKGNLLRSVPGAGELPIKYRTAEPICDHCGVMRRRNETFILRCDGDGSYKQIGRQCIRDFIGYDVDAFVESAKWLSGLEPSDSDGEGGYGGKSRDISLLGYLAHVHAIIRTVGWMSKKDAEIRGERPTAGRATENMFPLPRYRHLAIPLTDKDHAVAAAARDWAQALTGKSDYEYNLSVVAASDYIEWNEIGLAASMISGLFRHQEAELKRVERVKSLKGSQHLGTVGERLKAVPALVYGYRSFEGRYGATHMFRLRTVDNSVLVWFASSAQDCSIGDNVVLDGTVKKHDEYEGIAQTVLTRCNVTVQAKA